MANEEDGQPPPGKDDRVKAWLKHQEKDREGQTDSNAITTTSSPGTQLYGSKLSCSLLTRQSMHRQAGNIASTPH